MIANVGAPVLVGSLLLYRIINGHWGSVAFMVIVFAVVIAFYVRFVRIDHDDDEVLVQHFEDELGNDTGSSSGNH